jgi:hypothetical protein
MRNSEVRNFVNSANSETALETLNRWFWTVLLSVTFSLGLVELGRLCQTTFENWTDLPDEEAAWAQLALWRQGGYFLSSPIQLRFVTDFAEELVCISF